MCPEPESRGWLEDTYSQTAQLTKINTSISPYKKGEALERQPARSPVVFQGAAQHEERQPDGSAEGQGHESCNGTRRALRGQGGRREPPHRSPLPAAPAPPLRRRPGSASPTRPLRRLQPEDRSPRAGALGTFDPRHVRGSRTTPS